MVYTISEAMDQQFEHILNQPYGNGVYRDEFVKMRTSSKMLVSKLIAEFVSLLQLDDMLSVRKAAAIKYICKSVLRGGECLDFERLRDSQSYLDETVCMRSRTLALARILAIQPSPFPHSPK